MVVAAEQGVDVPGLLRGVLGRDRQATSDLAAAGGPVAGNPADEAMVAETFDRLASPQGLTAQASTFARQDVIAALGGQLVGADRAQLESLADRFLAERAVSVVGERSLEERRWSTPRVGAPGREPLFLSPFPLQLLRSWWAKWATAARRRA